MGLSGTFDFPLAPATAKTVIDEVASYAAGALDFETAAHGRAVLSFMHELVHYFQDLTTGVGHWDHLVHYRTNSELLGHAKRAGGPGDVLGGRRR